jgi:hypothetical protein
LVEQARAVLPEDGYQRLLGAVHTLRYVTELLEKKEASLANPRVAVSGPFRCELLQWCVAIKYFTHAAQEFLLGERLLDEVGLRS